MPRPIAAPTAGWVLGALLLVWLSTAARADEPPPVLVSIKPLHSLIASIMAGIGSPELIVAGGASPHDYEFKPADAERLGQARLVFWIGPMLEAFLVKPLASFGNKAEVVELAEAAGVRRFPLRSGGAWEPDPSEPSLPPGTTAIDGHLWLDPRNAHAIVALAVARLAGADPEHGARYTANAARLHARLDALDAAVAQKLSPVRGKRFVVFHDAYQYFERRYDLSPLGAITVEPQQTPGPGRLQALQRKVLLAKARCVFGEPGGETALVDKVMAGTTAHTATLDPEGIGLKPGPELYFDLLGGLSESLRKCLLDLPG